MIRVIEQLGQHIEHQWRQSNYNELEFPHIAHAALQELDSAYLNCWDVIKWVHNSDQLPPQQDIGSSFGQPPVTLLCGRRFYVDLLFWLDSTTAIHQHGFNGAFRVVEGSSLHSTFSYQNTHSINSRLKFGNIDLVGRELLHVGDTRQILHNDAFIHSLFHLEQPSVTLLVRTYGVPGSSPQWRYERPGMARDPFFQDPLIKRKVETLEVILRTRPQETENFALPLIEGSDFETCVSVLHVLYSHLRDNPVDKLFQLEKGRSALGNYIEAARQRHGRLIDMVVAVFEEGRRQGELVDLRAKFTDPESRYLLALAMNTPGRIHVMELVRQWRPQEDPVSNVIDWISRMANSRIVGSQDSALGVQVGEDLLVAAECLLQGIPPTGLAEELKDDFGDTGINLRVQGWLDTIRRSSFLRSVLLDDDSVCGETKTAPQLINTSS